MRQSKTFIPTLREVPADAEAISHQLLVKGGYIRQTASGIYSYLPLGTKVLRKVEAIIREELDRTGASEMLMPALQPAELWKETGRWKVYGPELMRMHDRNNREFALGPTHEEVTTSLVRDELNSYKKLPLTVYQIQTKYRDEQRPRFGLLRGREFIMKDAYSFHADYESLNEAYETISDAYHRIFKRVGLNFRAVVADSGAMGGKDTHEFMALASVGEDTIAFSDVSDYAANIEMAEVLDQGQKPDAEALALEKIETPDVKTMQEVADYLGHTLEEGLKAVVFKVDDRLVMVISRGDHEINDIKVKNLYQAQIVELATEAEVKELLGAGFGSLGPINVHEDIDVIADNAVKYVANVTCGANEDGFHYKNVNPERDFQVKQYADLRFIKAGDPSPDGNGTIQFAEGIEIGQVFKLGEFYAEKMQAKFLDEQGKAQNLIMGCYGIGVSRTLAAAVEQHSKEGAIVWPKSISPFQVHLISLNPKKDEQRELADRLYERLLEAGVDVLYDDRKERAGVKFADSDLIGIPVRITVGKLAADGEVEVKFRDTEQEAVSHENDLLDQIAAYL
ncbi:proline--tRNA ligase [Terribacillus saccharophilus]|uniref:Proline--tRNA ligase n=1 Tax=Terribacillus saccharophilus TaxID=361277 RepID=A0A268AAI1_9BACI|nr:proline--tRNA ligase [Terribacillus saccharophilus]PAD21134.1 proline--tRNA ligase [Terribacillus saccharophilus]PAF17447.1 proline--tRNA ligase [Terribacillus saccharophilus]PAF22215.1 proline--tRNA ligase [Terribacillus saccharophilus]PAF38408.1 proline--tRNA ligase [Terribacillus saccharophilus]PAF40165.1 proline--tRNA ligase [Terribacillus saccharophilus]